MAQKEKLQIDKFDGEDFHPRQVLIKYKLMSKGLWPCAIGTRNINLTNYEDVEDDEDGDATRSSILTAGENPLLLYLDTRLEARLLIVHDVGHFAAIFYN